MAWFVKSRLLLKVTTGLAAGVSAIVLAIGTSDVNGNTWTRSTRDKFALGKVSATWTTSFQSTTYWDKNWDRRDPEYCVKSGGNNDSSQEYKNKLAEVTPKARRHIFLIRHGQYEHDSPDVNGGSLTKKGREQAACTGERLKELGYPYTSLINSTMTRARETANIIHKSLHDLPKTETDFLREGSPFPPEPSEPLHLTHRTPQHEFHADGARIEAAFCKLFHRASPDQHKDSYEVVVCHANVIRYFVCRALQLHPEGWLRMNPCHCSITHLIVRPNGYISLLGMGDAGHIPSTIYSCSAF